MALGVSLAVGAGIAAVALMLSVAPDPGLPSSDGAVAAEGAADPAAGAGVPGAVGNATAGGTLPPALPSPTLPSLPTPGT